MHLRVLEKGISGILPNLFLMSVVTLCMYDQARRNDFRSGCSKKISGGGRPKIYFLNTYFYGILGGTKSSQNLGDM